MFLDKPPQPTPADKERRRLIRKLFFAYKHLAECAELVIVRRGVIDLYPDGPDKEQAEIDLAEAKRSLLCAIGTSDSARAELMCYIDAHQKEFVTTADCVTPCTSHDIIEKTWLNFFRRAKAVLV